MNVRSSPTVKSMLSPRPEKGWRRVIPIFFGSPPSCATAVEAVASRANPHQNQRTDLMDETPWIVTSGDPRRPEHSGRRRSRLAIVLVVPARAGNVRPLESWHRRCFPATLYWHDDILAAETSPPSARYFLKEPESKGVYPCVGYGGAV